MNDWELQQRGEPWPPSDMPAPGGMTYVATALGGQTLAGPVPTLPHQSVAHLLVRSLRTSARKAGLAAHGAVLLHLKPDRFVMADLVVAQADRLATHANAADTVLVGEITRPGGDYSGTPSRIEHYAAAQIPWFLLLQPESADYRAITLKLFRLTNGRYFEYAAAAAGLLLTSKDPFPFRIRTTDLVVF